MAGLIDDQALDVQAMFNAVVEPTPFQPQVSVSLRSR